ncbi:MAG TPA: YsnF/AvaK domain-containing protein [Ktedonobacteraceae bacterium]|nr:YsnF/AvaK domain-containing protein [Ktedonobacteraceae bacterium]
MARQRSSIVGVFDGPDQAGHAIESLYNAGVPGDRISYSSNIKSEGLLARLKNLFERQNTTPSDVIVNDLTNMGIPSDEARYYTHERDTGHTIVVVNTNGDEENVRNILRANGGHDYSQRAATGTTTPPFPQAPMGHPQAGPMAGAPPGREDDTPQSIRLREEQLRVQKERVQTGEVDIHKEVVTEQQTINVPVSHEEVVVERHPVSGGQVSDQPIAEGETVRIPVSEEQVHVTKQPVETEEVTIDKQAVHEVRPISETVQREELRTDAEGNPIIDEEPTPGQRGAPDVRPRPPADRAPRQDRDVQGNLRDERDVRDNPDVGNI